MLLLALYIVLATISVVAHGLELHMLRPTDTQPYGKQKDENCEVAHIMLLILSRINSKHFTVTQGKTAVGDRGMTKIILILCNKLAVLLPLK